MMSTFLADNRQELIERCKAKVALRPLRAATVDQLSNGVPLFLEQLRRTLEAEEAGHDGLSIRISGPAGGDALALSEIGVSATAHGKQLLTLGFTVDQVVHDYGDLCQSITDLAVERDAPFDVDEFRTLNRCLDNAIADAVTGFSAHRDAATALAKDELLNQRLGFLVHELRNSLSTAMLAVGALEHGGLPVSGATGAVLKRSLSALRLLLDSAIADVQRRSAVAYPLLFPLAPFIADAVQAAALYATASGSSLSVSTVDPDIQVLGNRDMLQAALANLLQNAFKFTRPGTGVTLHIEGRDGKIDIRVADHCGGLPRGEGDALFSPFAQRGADRTGLGLGLSIARQSVEADGGALTVRDVPGTGCVFTMTLRLCADDAAGLPRPGEH